MFGGVDALVESQDWWLRDQASLAMGFDNWMDGGRELDAGVNGGRGGAPLDLDLDPMTGVGAGFYMPPNGNSGVDAFGDDDWTYS